MRDGKSKLLSRGVLALTLAAVWGMAGAAWAGAAEQPNMVFIMGDDIGMWNIGATTGA